MLENRVSNFFRRPRIFAESEIRRAGNFVEEDRAVFIMPDIQRWDRKDACAEISAGRANSAELRCGSANLG